ncbi:hypothetical protein K3495_g10752 [Podosphaera aphanis]|nr:hypothetical protein K3495_g10752 [Podosphaera aphanis]
MERLYKVLQRAGYNDLKVDTIAKITKYCHQCQMHGGAPGRFRFTLHDDFEFNYRVVIDVMYINSRPVLHAVDEATSFQAARFLPNITAKTTWDTLRAMWIDMYVGPPDVIVTDAGKNFTAVEFRANAHAMAVKVEEVPVESHNSIGKVERYHHTLKRAYEVISADLGTAVTSEDTLQMAVKAVNDTAGPQGLVPTLLVFGTYPRLTESSPPSPSIAVRADAIRAAMTEVRKPKASRQLPLQSEVKVWRENIGWTGPHTLLARSDNDVTCTVDVNGKVINFRTVSVKPYHRDENTVTKDVNDSVDSPAGDELNDDEEYRPTLQEEQPQRKRGRPKGSRNAPKSLAVRNMTESIWMAEKEKLDAALSLKLRQEGKIATPGRPFEESDRLEVEALVGRGVFRFEKFDPQKHKGVRIFKSRMVREIKGKATDAPYEKSRLVIQGYNDNGKSMVLTQSPTIQRASQRIIVALAPSLLKRGMHLWLRDITQAYVQSQTALQRTVLAYLPKQIHDQYPDDTIMVVVKPLYGIAEAGAHWWATYFKHHCERLHMVTSTYDPCLLITASNSGYFGVVGMQTDDTLGISDTKFATQENIELQKAKFSAKEKQFLDTNSPLLFNGCILSIQANNVLFLQQKNQGERLKLVTNILEYIEQRARGAYLATICQPEASFDLSAAAQHKQLSKEDIARLNKRINWQISNVGRGLTYIPLDISKMRLFVFVDGSFANNNDMSSQIGFVIVLANEEAENDSFTITGNVVHWSSTKCKRITRSVLASEIYAMANGVDMAISINTTINKIVAQLGEPAISLVVCTDSFSLYECLVKLGTTKEKRLMIDIMALRQAYEQHEVCDIRRIDGSDNPADAMTKSSPNRALETLINDNKLKMRVQGWVKRSLEIERI